MTEISELISGGPAWRKERSWRFNYESCSSKSEAVDVVVRLDDVEEN
jgi:hypothetical protein